MVDVCGSALRSNVTRTHSVADLGASNIRIDLTVKQRLLFCRPIGRLVLRDHVLHRLERYNIRIDDGPREDHLLRLQQVYFVPSQVH